MKTRIKEILKDNERKCNTPMTISQLARLVGKGRDYISRIASGKIDPSIRMAMEISEALGFSTNDGIGSVFILDADRR